MLPLPTLPCKGQGSIYLIFLNSNIQFFLVQLDSVSFSEFKNIAHPVYLYVILILNSIRSKWKFIHNRP
jgi:hypothetical protein